MLDPQKLVWAALHEALDSPGTTTLDAWLALDTAWTAMTGANTAEESLSHMQHMASSLQRLATAPGWTKLNFPMGLSMAVMLHIQRYLIITLLYAETFGPPYQLVIDCMVLLPAHKAFGLQTVVNLCNNLIYTRWHLPSADRSTRRLFVANSKAVPSTLQQ